MINKVTEGFEESKESFGGIMSNFQEFMSTMIDTYDKIRDYEYKAQLTDFLGQMNSGQCSKSLSSDPERVATCSSVYQLKLMPTN